MPRAATPLNDTQIRKAKAKANEYVLSDTHGLGLRIWVSLSGVAALGIVYLGRPFSLP